MKLTVKKETVIELFETIGFKTVRTKDDEWLLKKAKELPEIVNAANVKNPKMKRLLKSLANASEIAFKDGKKKVSKKEDKTPKPTKATRTKKKIKQTEKKTEPKKKKTKQTKRKAVSKTNGGKKKKTTKKTKAKKTESTGKDIFGTRLSSKMSKVNKCLNENPKSMKELMKQSGIETSFYNHLNGLVKKGLVQRDDNKKYFLKK